MKILIMTGLLASLAAASIATPAMAQISPGAAIQGLTSGGPARRGSPARGGGHQDAGRSGPDRNRDVSRRANSRGGARFGNSGNRHGNSDRHR